MINSDMDYQFSPQKNLSCCTYHIAFIFLTVGLEQHGVVDAYTTEGQVRG